ncbi:unnamed protein product [Caretta caretta]
MMSVEGSTITSRIKNLLRSPSIKLRRSKPRSKREDISSKVTLEKVLGITVSGGRGLACDPRTGLVAYPAGSYYQLAAAVTEVVARFFPTWEEFGIFWVFMPPSNQCLVQQRDLLLSQVLSLHKTEEKKPGQVWDKTQRCQLPELSFHPPYEPHNKPDVSLQH